MSRLDKILSVCICAIRNEQLYLTDRAIKHFLKINILFIFDLNENFCCQKFASIRAR